MSVCSIEAVLSGNTYPGRGVLLGLTAEGTQAVAAYFIMGRSVNSRNRVFVAKGDGVEIHPFDPRLVSDPSLIIYSPLRVYEDRVIVTNGDQTDTVYDGLIEGEDFEDALMGRTYEPDAPNYTPRISGLWQLGENPSYRLSILKRENPVSGACGRYGYRYEPTPGVGHLIHTYRGDGDPLPSFAGEPVAVQIDGEIDRFAQRLWAALNKENRVALLVRYISLANGSYAQRIFNKKEEGPFV